MHIDWAPWRRDDAACCAVRYVLTVTYDMFCRPLMLILAHVKWLPMLLSSLQFCGVVSCHAIVLTLKYQRLTVVIDWQ